jgi:hypothetical protein
MPSLPLGDILIFHRTGSGTHADYNGNGTPQALGYIVISDRLGGARGERVDFRKCQKDMNTRASGRAF